jgi:cold shock protein
MAKAGRVKWFNASKGFGFITPEDGEEGEVFVHHDSIIGGGLPLLKPGERVSFDISEDRGHQAVNVRAVARET